MAASFEGGFNAFNSMETTKLRSILFSLGASLDPEALWKSNGIKKLTK